jgi:aminopeptidase YwaD
MTELTFSAKRAFEHVINLSSFGSRLAGTEGDKKSIDYMAEKFAEANLTVEFDEFQAPCFIEKETRLTMIYPKRKVLKARAMLYSPSTPSEGIKGEIVHVGYGTKEDFNKLDIKGKIVTFWRTKDKDAFWEEASNASKSGAEGIIMIDYNPWIFTATLETGFFNIEKRFITITPKPIPAVTIPKEDGLYLIDQASKGKVKINLKVDAILEDRITKNVRGIIKGSKYPDEKILVIAHRDSANTHGANDNASGLAVLLELAKVLPNCKPARTIELVALGAEEELGSLGSYNYCRLHKKELKNIKAVITVDMVAVGSKLKIITEGLWPDVGKIRTTDWLNKLLFKTAEELGYYVEYGICPFATSDEGRFLDAGVPATWLWKPDDPYYHSLEDTPDKINPNDLKIVCDIVGHAILKLSETP